jgi:hypothetical protein
VPAADRDSTAATEKASKAQLVAQLEVDDLHWLMGDVRGRRFVWRLLKRTGIYQTSFTGEALSMAFKEGGRNVGLGLLDEVMQHCPKRLSEMQTEARTNDRRKEKVS